MFVVECPKCLYNISSFIYFRASFISMDGSAKQAKKRLLNNFYCSF